MKTQRGKKFAQLVHQVLLTGMGVTAASEKSGIKYDTLYSRLRADSATVMSAEEIRALIAATGDRTLVDYFLDGSPFIAVDRSLQDTNAPAPHQDVTHGEIQGGAYRSVYVAAEILREVDNALKDRKIDHNDRREILEHVNEAEIALASLRAHLHGKIGPDPEQ